MPSDALGLLECKGLVTLMEGTDAMLKAGTPEKIDQEPIGTGPFYLVQYQKDAIIRYKAFPEFWGGKAKIDDLIFAITPDNSVRWAKLQKNECQVMPYPNPADLDAMRHNPDVQVLEKSRYVRDGNLVTAAGVSAGIDMALWLCGQLWDPDTARTTQRLMEYDPAPPYAAVV